MPPSSVMKSRRLMSSIGGRVSRPSKCLQSDQDSTGRFPRLASPYKISVALLRSATSCFGCSTNVNESFPLIAAALDEDLGLEVDVGAALNIVAYVVAVFLRAHPRSFDS